MKRGVKLSVALGFFILAAGAGWYAFHSNHRPATEPPKGKPSVTPPQPEVKKKAPQVAIVIDDVAYNTSQMDHFAALGVPLTFAILPRHKLAAPLSEKARSYQFAVLLHLPMEPHDVVNNDPGPSGLLLSMTDQQLKEKFDKDVASVPGLVGINNHMGSAFTEDEARMKLVLGWVKKRGLFFLDSYTSTQSKVLKAAKVVQIPCLRNETFLDNEDSVEGIERQLDVVMKLAIKRHRTIAIGHYRRKHIMEALRRKIPEFKAKGIEFVTLPTFYPK